MRRHIHLLIAATFVLLSLNVRPVEAVTIRDIVELTKAGLSDDIIVALLEADPTIFSLDAQTLMRLRREGVSERVLIEMLHSGRQPLVAPMAPPDSASFDVQLTDPLPAAPPVVVIEHHEPPRTEISYVPYPVFLPVIHRPSKPSKRVLTTEPRGFGRFINDGFRPEPARGFGRFINDGTQSPPQ